MAEALIRTALDDDHEQAGDRAQDLIEDASEDESMWTFYGDFLRSHR